MRRGFLLGSTGRNDRAPARRESANTPLAIPAGPVRPAPLNVPREDALQDMLARLRAAPQHGLIMTLLPSPPACSCLLFPGVKEHILATPGFPKPFMPGAAADVADVPGAGKGVLAVRDLALGALVVKERPLLLVPGTIPYARAPGATHPDAPLRMLVDQTMPPNDRALFLALHNCKSADPHDYRGIVDTNSLPVPSLPGHALEHHAVCALVSRINHSCSPNATYFWDLESFSFEVRAIRPIRKGEQVTISYLGVRLLPRRARQQELETKYAFRCACAACSLPDADAAASDARRAALAASIPPDAAPLDAAGAEDAELRAWAADPALPDEHVAVPCLRRVALLDAETWDEDRAWAPVLRRLVKARCALRDAAGARAWARRAAEMCRAFAGEESGRAWDQVAEEPQRTEWWGLRVAAADVAAADVTAADAKAQISADGQAGEDGSG